MKKLSKVLILTLILTLCMGSVGVFAKSSYKKDLKKLSDEISGYEYAMLFSIQQKYYEDEATIPAGGVLTLELDKNIMTRAAALCSDKCIGKQIAYEDLGYGEITYYAINKSALKSESMKLFGKKMKTSYLTSDSYSVWDAYNDPEHGPVIYDYVVETDTDLNVKSVSYSKSGKKYTITKQAYFGHWSGSEGPANIEITYTCKKSSKSELGYIITGIKIKYLN